MTLTPEERAILDEAAREAAANREHNRAAMDAAGVPRGPRQGFTRATSWNAYRILTIEERPRESRGSAWIVVCEMYPGAGPFCHTGWVVGPRGKATKAY